MASKTKIQIVNDCFTELRISGITANADNVDVVLALSRLEDYVAQLPFDIGFNFEETPDPNKISGIPSYANLAIALGLALNLAPSFGKAPESLIRQSVAAMSALQNRMATPKRVAYPSRQPLGRGNRWHSQISQFMPEVVSAPTSPETEIINLGDIKDFVIDFSFAMPSASTLSSYSFTQTSGIVVSSVSQDLMKLSFTATTILAGFQQVLFTATGDNGERANRVLNFNVVEAATLRANP